MFSIGQFVATLTPRLPQRFIPNVSAGGLLSSTEILLKICRNARSWKAVNRVLADLSGWKSTGCGGESGKIKDIRDFAGFGGSSVERQNFCA